MKLGPVTFEGAVTWKTWVFGVGLDFDDNNAGVCVGPFALWISW